MVLNVVGSNPTSHPEEILSFSTEDFLFISHPRQRFMHEVTPKVVAMAVRMVMAMWMIFCQSSFLFIVF